MNTISDLPGQKLIAGDSSATGTCLSMLSVPNYLRPFLEGIHQGSRIQHVTEPTRNRNILDFIFAKDLTHV